MKLTSKKVQKWIEETAKEEWKYHKKFFRQEGIKNIKSLIDYSYNAFNDGEYCDSAWSCGYISALKAVKENLERK